MFENSVLRNWEDDLSFVYASSEVEKTFKNGDLEAQWGKNLTKKFYWSPIYSMYLILPFQCFNDMC